MYADHHQFRRNGDCTFHHDRCDLGELAHFLIVQPGDALDAIEAAIGFPLLTHLFEVVSDHGGWFSAVTVLSDDGFGVELLVPEDSTVPLDLLQLCRGASEGAAT